MRSQPEQVDSHIALYKWDNLDSLLVKGLDEHIASVSSDLPPFNHRLLALRYERGDGTLEGLIGSSGGSLILIKSLISASTSSEERKDAYRALLDEVERISTAERECTGIMTWVFGTEIEVLTVLQSLGYSTLYALPGWFEGRLTRLFLYKSLISVD